MYGTKGGLLTGFAFGNETMGFTIFFFFFYTWSEKGLGNKRNRKERKGKWTVVFPGSVYYRVKLVFSQDPCEI